MFELITFHPQGSIPKGGMSVGKSRLTQEAELHTLC